ncbi:MAG TPA: hypothetical protein DDY78_09695 [Planctomycetales bacterium]|jgi:uncharacterized protein (DUF1501 family)|nr:hypothetical protein [Planctomycetales bacterium]
MSQLTRRRFLQTSLAAAPLVALAPTVPSFLVNAARAGNNKPSGRILVVVELAGGNDGVNTVVPFADEGYARARNKLRLPREGLIRLNDEVGLHPSLKPLAATWEAGRLAVVQGVSYPNPSRSHFVSRAVWHTARPDGQGCQGVGWLGRALDQGDRRVGQAVYVGDGPVSVAVCGQQRSCISIDRPEDCRLVGDLPLRGPAALVPASEPVGDGLLAFTRRAALDAYATADQLGKSQSGRPASVYPANALGRRLQTVASAIKAGLQASTYYMVQGGESDDGVGDYDTHVGQLSRHAGLLAVLASAWRSFLDDLAAAGLADRVVLLAYSEFGRRVEENASGGTDHGTAGPVFLAGGAVRGGLVGATPKLLDLEEGDLKAAIDFRQVYATVLEDWLALPAKEALGGAFEKLSLFRA